MSPDELGEAGGVVRRVLLQTHGAGAYPGGPPPTPVAGRVNRRVVPPTTREAAYSQVAADGAVIPRAVDSEPVRTPRDTREDGTVADSPAVVPVEVTFTRRRHRRPRGDRARRALHGRLAGLPPLVPARRGGRATRVRRVPARAARRTCPSCCPPTTGSVAAVGGGDLAARFLSHWNPPPLFAACSLAAWSRERNVLVRNYDYPPTLCDAMVVRSRWNDTAVLAMSDCGIGALDGVNEHGLAVAIAFGGRRVVGDGFGIGIVVRYVLEFAADVPTALEMLARIPVHLAYNVALAGQRGAQRHRLPLTGPRDGGQRRRHRGQPAGRDRVARALGVLRHRGPRGGARGGGDRPGHDGRPARQAVPRAAALPADRAEHLGAPSTPRCTTPTSAALDLRWPDDAWSMSLDDFVEGSRTRARCPWRSRRPSSRTLRRPWPRAARCSSPDPDTPPAGRRLVAPIGSNVTELVAAPSGRSYGDRTMGQAQGRAKPAKSKKAKGSAAAPARPVLRSLSDVYGFFRTNTTPVYFVSPTPYNLLGLDEWVGGFRYISYFDSFDGLKPHSFAPTHEGPRDFESFESVNTYLLGNKEVIDYISRNGTGIVLFVMFDEDTEQRAHDLGLRIALPPRELRQRIDSKVVTTRLGNEAGVAQRPERHGPRRHLQAAAEDRQEGQARQGPRRPDAVRRLGAHDVLHRLAPTTGTSTRRTSSARTSR